MKDSTPSGMSKSDASAPPRDQTIISPSGSMALKLATGSRAVLVVVTGYIHRDCILFARVAWLSINSGFSFTSVTVMVTIVEALRPNGSVAFTSTM